MLYYVEILPFGSTFASSTIVSDPFSKLNPFFGRFWTNCLVKVWSNWALHAELIPRTWHMNSIGSWDNLKRWSIWLKVDSSLNVLQPRLAPSISSLKEATLQTQKQQSENKLRIEIDVEPYQIFAQPLLFIMGIEVKIKLSWRKEKKILLLRLVSGQY